MASSNDAIFAEEVEIDQEVRERERRGGNGSKSKLRTVSPTPEIDEEAPLLSDAGSSYDGRESVDSRGKRREPEWFGHAELRGLPWWKKPSIFWLLPPFLLFTLAFGATVVPKLNLIMDLVCEEYYASQDPDPISGPMDPGQDRCRTDAVSARASLFLLYGNLCSGILAAITSPKLGALSDRYGRKKLLVLTTCGTLVGELLTILAAKYPEVVHVNWILVGYAIDGLCGSFIVGMAIAHSYATDCTPPQKRNVAFGYFHACLFTGIAVGPVVAGYLINARAKYVGKTEAVLLVFYIALGCHVIFIILLGFVIPESLSKARQESAREKHREEVERLGPAADWINQLRSINILAPLRILWPTGPGTSSALRWNLILLAAVDTIMFGVAMGAMGVIVVYVRMEFAWQELESGRFVSIVNSSRVLALLVLLPLVTRLVRGKVGTKNQRNSGSDLFDLSMIRLAVFFDMLGFLGYTLARDGTVFILSGAVAAIGGIGSPTLGSALTKHVPPDRVGQLLGATGLLHAFARVLGPTIFNGIYSATVASYRQTVFVCLTVTFGIAFVCSWFVRPHVYLDDLERRQNSDDEEIAAS
ncbi:tetracycline-efflux transporter-like protein [Lentithecium fluviatile CBS 122367]|uniref:Tetracycline-efflux transporter-like protein n=1 Tax=Lentithecium fluviatile CBS 122367 TaxID=1168545 RepID=A0A6G1IJD6_9PLEO|nr:tetracycline-efflux transporter-like protein [Lentithecium fluviatile CBS 122367]